MIHVSVRDARERLAELLSAAQSGQTVEVTRHGQAVAHIVPPPTPATDARKAKLPDLAEFRQSLARSPRRPKATITSLRRQDRY